MSAQIIFFTAVALFLIILLRRTFLTVLIERVWHLAKTRLPLLLRSIAGGLSAFKNEAWKRSQAARQASRRPANPRQSVAASEERSGVNQHDFWKEEAAEERKELLSHYDEGETLFRAGKLEEAEKFFLTAATRSPKDPKVYARLGLIYLQRKNYSDAIEALKVAVKFDKHNATRYYNLALAYAGKSDNQRAIATIREAISLDPVSPKYRKLLEQLLNKK
jgi:tetratricopeptide (TPR) repeat protein